MNKAFKGVVNRIGLPNNTSPTNAPEKGRKFTFSLGRSKREIVKLEDEEEEEEEEGGIDDDQSDDSDHFMYFGFATPFDKNSQTRQQRATGCSEASVDASVVADEVNNGMMIQHRKTGEGMGRRPDRAAQVNRDAANARPGGRKSRPSFAQMTPMIVRARTLSDDDELGAETSFTGNAPQDSLDRKLKPSPSYIHAPVPLLVEGDEEEEEDDDEPGPLSPAPVIDGSRNRDRSVSRDVQPQLSPRETDADVTFGPPPTSSPGPPDRAQSTEVTTSGSPSSTGRVPTPPGSAGQLSSPLLAGRKRPPPKVGQFSLDNDELGSNDRAHQSPIVSGRKTNIIMNSNRSVAASPKLGAGASEPIDNFGSNNSASSGEDMIAPLTSQNLNRYTNISINRLAHRQSVSVTKKRREQHELQFGKVSREIDDAYDLNSHIIVFGNDANIHMFISELRRPAVRGETYHPILIVATTKPSRWEAIAERFNDVYFLQGSITKTSIFAKANTERAFSVTLMSTRDSMTKVEDENIDASTLFTYLKLEQYIPRNVFFGVELTCSANMAVLNATIMRRARAQIVTKAVMLGAMNPKLGGGGQSEPPKSKLPQKSPQFLKNIKSATNGSLQELKSMFSPKPSPKFLSENQTGFGATVRNLITSSSSKNDNKSISNEGRFFSSKRASITSIDRRRSSKLTAVGKLHSAPSRSTLLRRSSSVVANSTALIATSNETKQVTERRFWDAMDTHHVLPVFASGKAYVPASFESLLVQSFYSVLTPVICDKLVCGQRSQTVMQSDVPEVLVGRRFVDLLRTLATYNVICFGIFRAPQARLKAELPYLYISPTVRF